MVKDGSPEGVKDFDHRLFAVPAGAIVAQPELMAELPEWQPAAVEHDFMAQLARAGVRPGSSTAAVLPVDSQEETK